MMMIVLKNISFIVDKKAELKKLNRSILICFLELLDILIDNPSSPEVSPSKYFQWMPKRRGDQLSLSLSLLHSAMIKSKISTFSSLTCIT